MPFAVRMRTVSRLLVFVGSAVLWLILLTLLNRSILRLDDLVVVIGALAIGAATTILLAYILRI